MGDNDEYGEKYLFEGKAPLTKFIHDDDRFMKKLILVAVIVLELVLGFSVPSHAWQVQVRNDTSQNANVDIYISSIFNYKVGSIIIVPGATGTIDTGGWCPSGLTGAFVGNQKQLISNLASTSCLGHEIGPAGFSACCWNSSWTICRKRGDDQSINDKDYGFCKQ